MTLKGHYAHCYANHAVMWLNGKSHGVRGEIPKPRLSRRRRAVILLSRRRRENRG